MRPSQSCADFFLYVKLEPDFRGVRGKPAVYNAIYSITVVHNIMQMAGFYKKQRLPKQKKTGNKPETVCFSIFFSRIGLSLTCEQQRSALKLRISGKNISPKSICNSVFSGSGLLAVPSHYEKMLFFVKFRNRKLTSGRSGINSMPCAH
jgi:hypothetical protein